MTTPLPSGRRAARDSASERKALWEAAHGGRLDDVCLSVVDLMTGAPKPRCRNCLYLTRDAAMVVTDALVWDGDMSKQRRAPQLAKRAGAKPHKVQKRKKR